jgi:hypothetical protein
MAPLLLACCLESPPEAALDGGSDPFDCPGNLVANHSFENGTGGWLSYYGTVTTIADAPLGNLAAQMCSDGTAENGYYSLDDEPDAVLAPKTGEKYELRAAVRAGPQAGQQDVQVVVREHDLDDSYHPHPAFVSPGEDWQVVTTSLTVESASPGQVDVYVASTDPAAGNCFQVDALCLQRR